MHSKSQYESAFLAHKDLLETEKNEVDTKRLLDKLQSYKDEFTTNAQLEKKLTEKAKRCQALRKKMEQKMNASKAKYKDQILGLKDEIERAKVDLKHYDELLERQAGDLAKKDEKLA
ncbi:hypothetical protein ACOSP7_024107 [Xanthoceras sorbifolium]